VSTETRTGLAPWTQAELPAPPVPRGLAWVGVVGPGVIVLGASIGSGEFLLGPAAFLKYGFSLLGIVTISLLLQTLLNLEVMRYVVATGEPVFTGFMRTRPSSTAWAWFYAALFFLQYGWPAWAAASAAAAFYLVAGHLPGPADSSTVYWLGIATFLLCIGLLLFGKRIARTLEIVNWVLVVVILASFLVLALAFVPGTTWLAAAAGYVGFDTQSRAFEFIPPGMDWFLIGALVGYAGGGGLTNVMLGNWARDKGYGMAARGGYIPGLGEKCVPLAHGGFTFTPDAGAMPRWRGWWRIVRVDQWGIFFVGAMLGMSLPALLYVTFLPPGTDIRGLGISAALAESMGARAGPLLAGYIAFLGVWLLFKTQLDLIEGMTRSLTEILWTGSERLRNWRGGDVRAVYYAVLAAIVVWGVIALGLAPPVVLLQLSANIAAAIFVLVSLHVLYLNTRLLPPALRPPLWRRIALVAMAAFYGFFAVLSIASFAAG
jgi:hypothetical protein